MVFWRRPAGKSTEPRGSAAEPALPSRRRRWSYAFAASLLAHVVVTALGLPRLLVAPPEEIEVTYLPDVAPDRPQPADSDALAEDPPPPPPPEKVEPPPEPERRLAEPQPKKPEPLEVVPLPNLPMVDQEQFPDEADNEKARFLAQKNHRAKEDVQAKERTLEKPPPASSESAPPGEPSPKVAPTAPVERVAKASDSPLRMRQPGAELSDPVAPAPGGDQTPWVPAQPSQPGASVGAQDMLPIAPSRLGPRDYDRLVGESLAQAERRAAALAENGSQPGYWDRLQRKQDALRASLENFVGNVRTGNQSELGTRKHPFAAFITSMHRQIHRYWGDGFLADIDRKGRDVYPQSLISAIEISVAQDGKLDGLIIVKPSGSLPFDTAALDAVMSAAPFPAPPEAIKSRDGKVYLTWYFHRDDRQCHPNYVNMHILTTPPQKKLAPPVQMGPKLASPLFGGELGKPQLGRRDAAPAPAPKLESADSSAAAGPGAAATAGPGAAASASAKTAPSVPDAAREATERWLAAYQRADAALLGGASGLPFTAGGKQVADDGPALRAFFQEMLSEGVPRRQRVTYYTPPQLRGKLGRLPRGADEDDMVFAWVEFASEELILLLSPTNRGWSVVGLDR